MARRARVYKTPEQEARAMAEREANARALEAGEPLPYPNMWDAIDPTKVRPGATHEEILESVRQFNKLCAPRPRKIYIVSPTT